MLTLSWLIHIGIEKRIATPMKHLLRELLITLSIQGLKFLPSKEDEKDLA